MVSKKEWFLFKYSQNLCRVDARDMPSLNLVFESLCSSVAVNAPMFVRKMVVGSRANSGYERIGVMGSGAEDNCREEQTLVNLCSIGATEWVVVTGEGSK